MEIKHKQLLLKKYEESLAKLNAKPIFLVLSGAHMFGFPSEDSDYDLRGVFAYPTQRLLGFETPKDCFSEIAREEPVIDITLKEIRPFLMEVAKNNGNFLEQLYSPLVLQTSPEHEEIKQLAKNCLSRRVYDFYSGFAQGIRNQGDITQNLKNFLYAARVYMTGERLLRTGEVVTDLTALNRDDRIPLIDEMIEAKKKREIQKFEGDKSHLDNMLNKLQARLDDALQVSSLPPVPLAKGIRRLESFLIEFRRTILEIQL